MAKRILIYTNHFFPEQFKINDIVDWLKDENYSIKVITGIPNYPQGKFYKALYDLMKDFRNLLKKKTKSVEVLDYGCGSGNFAQEVSAFGPKKIVAVDISEQAIKKAMNNEPSIDWLLENQDNIVHK